MNPTLKTIDMTFTQTQPTSNGSEQTLRLKSIKEGDTLAFVLESKGWNFTDSKQVAELLQKLQDTAKSLEIPHKH